ncbi:MAG TPA: hypothetical protein VM869_04190, partial [Enhygromyxa sp.]|nr:hypothetical protein [Enhygromyxa sp.]
MARASLLRTSALAATSLLALACTEPDTAGTSQADATSSESSGDGDGDPDPSDTEEGETGNSGEGDCTDNADAPWQHGYSIPMEPQSPGDPELGRLALFEEDYVACGVPWELFGLAKGAIGSIGEGEELAWRSGKNAQVPHSWNVNAAPDGSE